MRASRPHRTAVLLLSGVAAACGGGAGASPAPGPAPDPAPARPPADRAPANTTTIEALYRARLDSARMRFTEADVHFVTGMIGHHAQALVMAGLAPTHGAGPAVSTLAARIVNAQRDEIATMSGWLDDRGQAVPEVRIEGTTLAMPGAEHALHMPGMLTRAQIDELDRARGRDFDRLFLTFMIQHHAGAVTMVRDLFATDGAAQDEAVFKLASDIQVDQTTEIARMKGMLGADGGSGGARRDPRAIHPSPARSSDPPPQEIPWDP